ncbi:MAG: hypothetical protein PHF86_03365 [Candidatus Nanoarchaeia archaeon]|jgi:hypothetical protein|nr:hypothetical protein [Candidatus Nanoarchaeia archaeon]
MLNSDTQRYVDVIKKQGWYPGNQTLGAGGWQAVNKFASNWKTYLLEISNNEEGVEPMKVVAKDGETALIAFAKCMDLAKCAPYRIVEKITIYKTIKAVCGDHEVSGSMLKPDWLVQNKLDGPVTKIKSKRHSMT